MSGDEAMAHLRVQEYLDDVSNLNLPLAKSEWYNIDVAALLVNCRLIGHDIDEATGCSLLFLEKSVMMCCPNSGRMHHYPKHLLHCFIDDKRNLPITADGVIFKAELFSISPSEEQLCWEEISRSEMEIPMVQNKIARWLSWLNT
ncbi:MAG: hypothetical protein OR994_00170 [Candidatus Poseidoniales archaeon]|jgi:hypothetical protein|nr:hypothetical protein [Candidatus Poseidoniales archaeon]|tara:strand:- start:2649 stop:3083 length:435 start_codon:yes stop_codon:yes gene_type:complete